MLGDALAVAVVLALWGAALAAYVGRNPRDRDLTLGSAALHVLACVGQYLLIWYWYGYGDAKMYLRVSGPMADEIWRDPTFAWKMIEVFFHGDPAISFVVPGVESTRSMVAVVVLGCALLGNSPPGLFLSFAAVSYWGKVALWVGLRGAFAPSEQRWVGIATLFGPSAVWWTSGLVKEALAFGGYGLAHLAAVRVAAGERRWGVGLLAGALFVALVKPYVLLVAVLAAAVGTLWSGSVDPNTGRLQIRALPAIGSLVGAAVALAVLVTVAPRYSPANLLQEAAREQEVGFSDDAGNSRYSVGVVDTSPTGLLRNLPVALFTGLFRPSVLDARNPLMLVNALETTLFLGLTLRALLVRGPGGMLAALRMRPVLVYCLAYSVVLGFATGLTSSNLGTLSRYRSPLVPLFLLLLVAWNARDFAERPLGKPAPPGAAPRPPGPHVRPPPTAWVRPGGSLPGPGRTS